MPRLPRLRLGAVLLGALALLGVVTAGAAWRAASPSAAGNYIVVLHDGVDAQAVSQEHARTYGLTVTHLYEHTLIGYAARIPSDRLDAIRADARVQYVEEDGEVRALGDVR
jgi:hypothetical protein